MSRVSNLEPLVEKALRNCEEAKKDDFILYLEVIKEFVDVRMSVDTLFANHSALGLPPFESVSRCRRKLQERDLSLLDSETYRKRMDHQQEFIDYAMGDKVGY